MTRRGSGDERRWRRRRNLEPGADGSIHGEQPVEPKGRDPREKPSGHRHKDPQPAKVHDNTKHDPPMVENAGGAPQAQRGTRAAQPSPGAVPIGSRYIVSDEAELQEVATDSDADGTADTWAPVSATESDHGNERHTPNMVINFAGAPRLQRGSRADQPAPADVPAGSRYVVTSEDYAEEIAVDTDGSYQDTYENIYGQGEPDTWLPVVDGSASRDPHGNESHKNALAPNPHGDGAHDNSVATNPHSDKQHSRDYDADFLNASGGDTATGTITWESGHPQIKRTDGSGNEYIARIDFPSPDSPRFVVRKNGGLRASFQWDESNATWDVGGPVATDHGMIPTQVVAASDSRQQNIRNSDFQSSSTDDHQTIQNAINELPVGTK